MLLDIASREWTTFTSPEEMIQSESDALDAFESMGHGNSLKLWESPVYFVVLGLSNKPEVEVNLSACAQDNIPVIKRCSGGGTVLQGPGCLNYSFVVEQSLHAGLEDIQKSNRVMMEHIRHVLTPILPDIDIKGVSDLVYQGQKFSGNAQRRKKTHLLFHGTILYDFDITKIETYLKFPSRKPDYRGDKSHLDFCRNIPVSQAQIKTAFLD